MINLNILEYIYALGLVGMWFVFCGRGSGVTCMWCRILREGNGFVLLCLFGIMINIVN